MRDASEPFQPFNLAAVRAALGATRMRDVRYVAQTGSTNDDVAGWLGEDALRGTTLVADHQTAGRGRKVGRSWEASPARGLLFTSILPRVVAARALWCVPFWVALAVADAISERYGLDVALKWPNDGLLNGAKLFGILCISRVMGDDASVACGVGINVLPDPIEIGADYAKAWLAAAAPNATREALLIAVLQQFDATAAMLDHPEAVARRYERRAGLVGLPYRAALDAQTMLDGIGRGIDEAGRLRLEVDGVEHRVSIP